MSHLLGRSPTRLRQIALVVQDLQRAKHLLTTVIGTEVIYVDPAVGHWGLENFLVAIGGDVIEVVSPIRPSATAGRLLEKRGDGGYMIIMQTVDALARKAHIESNKLARVVFCHETDESVCVQYHPKGIRGGVIPELDSHYPTTSNPDPIYTLFSPWHACGPSSSYSTYSAGMKWHADLKLLGVKLRLKSGEKDTHEAAKTWEQIFGTEALGPAAMFTNGRVEFVNGVDDKPGGIIDIRIGVKGSKRLRGIFERAEAEGCPVDEDLGAVDMLGVRLSFYGTEALKSIL